MDNSALRHHRKRARAVRFTVPLEANEVAQEVEWPTLVFFAGLFVMVGGLVATGVIDEIAHAATGAVEGKLWPATMLLLWASAALSAIVDNIPYVAR